MVDGELVLPVARGVSNICWFSTDGAATALTLIESVIVFDSDPIPVLEPGVATWSETVSG
jgi:hypothetical protein